MDKGIMVSVMLVAYNHEKFIRDAIEGILKQETKFDYEILVHDDASTDRTPVIIREYEEKYPTVIKAVYEKENQYQKGTLKKVLYTQKINGKYFATLDGDDYWTDADKLQKQVDFLETHEDYSMCMHNAIQKNDMTGETKLLNTFPEDGTYSQEEQVKTGLGSNFPATASYLFRTIYLKDLPELFYKADVGDYMLRQYYANCGKVYYFKKPMSVYRVAVSGSYMSNLRKDESFYNEYTLKMIDFLEHFNTYTKGKFNHNIGLLGILRIN